MTELLHLWRAIVDASVNNSFFGMERQNTQDVSNISARSNGTFERFILRISPSGAPNFASGNESASLVTLDLLINGIVQPNSKIQIAGIGQTGIFLPISQLPVAFLKDDDIVVRLTGMSPVIPNPFPFVRMEIDFNLRFEVVDLILPNKMYFVGHTQLNSAGEGFRSLGGSPSLSAVQSNNTVPAMGSGSFKKLRTNIYIDTGDNLDVRTYVNGAPVIHGPALDGVGIKETDLGSRAFVKDDLIGISLGRTASSGTIDYNTQIEVEYESTEFWFYGGVITAGANPDVFYSILSANILSNVSPPFPRSSFQKTLGREGLIKDFVYYGTAPAGAGTTVFEIEVNNVSVFSTGDVAAHAGNAIDRFDNVNVLIQPNDLVNLKINGRTTTNLEGLFGMRVILL